MKNLIARIRYYKGSYIMLTLYFCAIFILVLFLCNLYTNDINKRKNFYNNLHDDYYYSEGLKYNYLIEKNYSFDGVMYNIEMIEVNDVNIYVYHYYGDINVGIPYSQSLIIEAKEENKLSDVGVIASNDAYDLIKDLYDVKSTIETIFPYMPSIYSTKRIDKYPLILKEEDVSYFDVADYAIFKSEEINNPYRYALEISKGNEIKKDIYKTANMLLTLFDAVMIIPIITSMLCLLPLIEFIFKDMKNEINSRFILGQRKIKLYLFLFTYLMPAIMAGLILGSIVGIIISKVFFKVNYFAILYMFLFSVISITLIAYLILNKILKRRLKLYA